MNTYRVDRNDSKSNVPCGMNSILYIGDSLRQAERVFNNAEAGINSWNQANANYGVTLSTWDSGRNDYVVKRFKGF